MSTNRPYSDYFKNDKSQKLKSYNEYFDKNTSGEEKDPFDTMFNRASSGVLGVNTDYGNSKYDENLNWGADIDQEDIEGSINEHRAQEQSGLAQVGLGLVRAGSKAVQEIAKIPGVVGGISLGLIENTEDLISGEDNNSFIDTAFNNAWIKKIDEIGEKINTDVLPVYTAKAVKEGNLWDNISSTAFWATDGADGLGFLAGMMVPGAIFEYAGLGGKLINTLSNSKRLANLTSMSGKAEQGVNVLKSMGITGKTIDGGLAVMGNTILEAGAEAKGVGDDLEGKKSDFIKGYVGTEDHQLKVNKKLEELDQQRKSGIIDINKYNELSSTASESVAEETFKEQRALAMRNTFVSNVAILLGPNAIMHKAIWGKAAQKFEKSTEQGLKAVAKRVGKSAGRVGKAFATEGFFEEGSQTTVENMYVGKAMGNELGKDDERSYLDQAGDMIGDFSKEYANTLSTTDGQKAIFLGGALGGPMMSYQGRKQDVKNRKYTNSVLDGIDSQITNFNNIFDNDIYQKNEDGTFKYKKDANNNDTTERLLDNKAVRKVAQDLNFTEQQSAMFDFAVKTGNTEVVDRLKQEAIFNLVLPSIHNGEMGIQALEEKLQGDTKFQELLERDAKSDEKDKTKEFVKQTIETAKYLQKQNEKFGDFSRDVIDLTHPTATKEQKDSFLNKLNSSYLNIKHQLRQNETSLKSLEEKRNNIFEELGIDPLYEAESEFPTAKMKNGVVSDKDLMQRAESTKNALNSNNELLNKTEKEYSDLKQKIEKNKKDIADIWQGKDAISGAFNDFVDKDNKETEDTSDEKVEQANNLINGIKQAASKKELDQLLLPAHVPQKTEADYNRETESLLVDEVSKSIEEDQSLENLKLNLDKLKAINISSIKIDAIAKLIEDEILRHKEEQDAFKDYLLGAIEAYDQQDKEINDFISGLNKEIDSLLKSKDTLIKSLDAQEKSPRGRNAKLIKQLIKEAEDELKKVEGQIEYLEGLKEEANKELDNAEKELSYIFNRYDQIEKSDFSSVQDIVDYLNTNKELFKDHRFDFERLLVNKYYTEQNIEGLSVAIDELENYSDVLKRTIRSLLDSEENHSEDLYYLQEQLNDTTEDLTKAKKDLRTAQDKLRRLNRAIIDKQAIDSVKSEEEFWNDLQKFKRDKINPLINNPVIAQQLADKKAELDEQERQEAEDNEAEQTDLQEDQIINNPQGVTEVVGPTVTLDEDGNFQSDSLPTQEDENQDNEPLHGENMSEDEVDESLKQEVSGAKVISTNRETGEALSDNLKDFVNYERTPIDKSDHVITFEVGDLNKASAEVEKAYARLLKGTATDKDITLLKEKLPIKIVSSYKDEKGENPYSFIEAKTQANQADPDSKEMFEQQTMPLRERIIDEAVKNKGLQGITTNIVKQYPGLLTVDYQEDGVAKNDIFGLQVFDGMSEDEKVLYFQKNSSFVNWEGNLVSTLNPKKIIKSNFGLSHKGEVFLMVPQNNGQPFYLKLNVSKVSEEKAEAIYEMVTALSLVSKTISSPTSFQAMTVGKFFEALDTVDPDLSKRIQKTLKNEIDFVKKYNKADEKNESLSRFLDLLIYHKSQNKKTAFNLSPDGNLTLGSLANHLMDGQGFRHKLTITKDELADPVMKETVKDIITQYIQYKRHNIIITKDAVGEFVFNNKDYVKYLLNSKEPILTTNAVVNQPTFQGYSNVYLNQDVKNSKSTSPISGRGTIAPIVKEVISDNDWNDFVDNNKVSEKILEDIAKSIINGSILYPREQAIHAAKTSEIEKIIKKIAGSKKPVVENKITTEQWDDYYGTTNGKYEDGKVLAKKFYNTLFVAFDALKVSVANLSDPFIKLSQGKDSLKKHGFTDSQIKNLEKLEGITLYQKLDSLAKRVVGMENTDSNQNDIADAILNEFNGREVELFNSVTGLKYGAKQQVLGAAVDLETVNEDGSIPSVKAKFQAALGNSSKPTSKQQIKTDTNMIKEIFEKSTEDAKSEILFNLADSLNSLDSIDVDNLSKTFDNLLKEADKQNKSIDEINKICGI